MRSIILVLFQLAVVLSPLIASAESGLKRYLYMSTPDAAQPGGSGKGILVFDIDDNHRFVKHIDWPLSEGLRGFCGNAKRHAVYYTTTSHKMGAFDVETEKMLWEQTYPQGCDRACITPDGNKIYAPTGWWYGAADSGFYVINAEDGKLIKTLPGVLNAHNSIMSLNGKFAYLGGTTTFAIFNTSDDSLVRKISDVGESGVFPFTVDSKNRRAYICLGKHVGVDVVDLEQGKVLHRVLAGETPIPHRTHGAALTPDEKELWVSDQVGKKLFYFDATQEPPVTKGSVDLSLGGHGWVSFSLDGRFAWCNTPDVIDAHTHKVVATLKDDQGKPVCGSKFIEIHFRDGKVIGMGDQFGVGRAVKE